jgi:hypothetical protein
MKELEVELGAQVEFFETALRLESESAGLGFRFEHEVELTFSRIQENPKAYVEIAPDTRRPLVHVFPYGVTYHEFETKIIVVAILHLHRHPDTWRAGGESR